ncbi:MAG: mechanosensitive ion channel family protein [Pyrinomonadaceae bacterium]
MERVLERLKAYFDPAVIAAKTMVILENVVIAAIILLAFYILYRILRGVLVRIITRFELEKTFVSFLFLTLKYTIFIFAAVTTLDQIGLNITSLLAGLGIAGLALGFAAKDTLSNIVAGIFIFWDRPFYIGDLVEIEGEYGEVQDITLRTTRIVTPDGRMISIPNQNIAANKITSYTMFPHLRLDVEVTIGVEEKIAGAREKILEIVRDDPRFLKTPEPVVLVQELGNYYTKLELRVWLEDTKQHINVRAELREKIKDALDAAGVEMPFETLEILNKIVKEQQKTKESGAKE